MVLYSVLSVSPNLQVGFSLPWSNARESRIRDHNRDKDIRGLLKYVSPSNVVPHPSNSRNKVARILPNDIARVSSRRMSEVSTRSHDHRGNIHQL